MGSIDGEIPAVWFLISSIGFIILSVIQYKNTGKSINTIFLSSMAVIFFASYLILLTKQKLSPKFTEKSFNYKKQLISDNNLNFSLVYLFQLKRQLLTGQPEKSREVQVWRAENLVSSAKHTGWRVRRQRIKRRAIKF